MPSALAKQDTDEAWFEELLGDTPKKTDDFRQALQTGRRYELLVASKLLEEGFWVRTPVMAEDSTTEEYTQRQQDLIVGVGGRNAVIEVKSRALKFNDLNDFPFDSVFIDTVSGWDKKAVTPGTVLIISQPTEAILVVPVKSTMKHWTEEKKYIPSRGYKETSYAIDPALTKSWGWFIGRLKQLQEAHED